jgi:hypothetical protein
MVERKRAARGYAAVAGDDNEERDIELGESVGGQVSGVVRPTVEEELDTWDENAEDDWDVADGGDMGNPPVQDGGDLGVAESKKRAD